jgi:ceramide glucosyltransferase
MPFPLSFLQWIFLIPTVGGALYGVLCLLTSLQFRIRPPRPSRSLFSAWPPVTILKPICGPEKNQRQTLRSACLIDYPKYQVVFSVQSQNDPAIPLLKELEQEFGSTKVSVAMEDRQAGPNGKINNLLGALPHARYDILVISDSDVYLRTDYLKTIVSPLADPDIGCVCTLYRATRAGRWFEKMELLTLNADFVPSVIFAYMTGTSKFCLGSSVAFRRSSLREMGGLESLADYLAEDYEMGRRLWVSGKRTVLVPYFVDIVIDLKDTLQWWDHQVCWDQKTRAARPVGFFATIVTRSVPFALLFAALRLGDGLGLATLAGALGLRIVTAAGIMRWALRDREGLKSLGLLPLRDIAALASWFLAFTRKTVTWRASRMSLKRDGRLAKSGVSR